MDIFLFFFSSCHISLIATLPFAWERSSMALSFFCPCQWCSSLSTGKGVDYLLPSCFAIVSRLHTVNLPPFSVGARLQVYNPRRSLSSAPPHSPSIHPFLSPAHPPPSASFIGCHTVPSLPPLSCRCGRALSADLFPVRPKSTTPRGESFGRGRGTRSGSTTTHVVGLNQSSATPAYPPPSTTSTACQQCNTPV